MLYDRCMTRASVTPARTEGIIGYCRVSTDSQAESGLGLDDQRYRIEQEAERRGLPIIAMHVDAGASGGSTVKRPALAAALADLDTGNGSMLMAAKGDRVSRSLLDTATLLQRATEGGWAYVTLDTAGLDTSTPAGRMAAHILASFAEYEHELIRERTVRSLQAAKRAGRKLGRGTRLPADLVARIVELREQEGRTFQAIADRLNADGVPTAQGGAKWHPSSVSAVIAAHEAELERLDLLARNGKAAV